MEGLIINPPSLPTWRTRPPTPSPALAPASSLAESDELVATPATRKPVASKRKRVDLPAFPAAEAGPSKRASPPSPPASVVPPLPAPQPQPHTDTDTFLPPLPVDSWPYRADSPTITEIGRLYASDTDLEPSRDLGDHNIDPCLLPDYQLAFTNQAGLPPHAPSTDTTTFPSTQPALHSATRPTRETRMSTANMNVDDLEAKHQRLTQSFHELASAMTRTVALIEDYTRSAPSALTTRAALSSLEDATAAFHALGGNPLGVGMSVDGVLAGASSAKKPRQKREKKLKDPNAPKRPPSAYILYQNEVREAVRAAHPGVAYKDILGIIAGQWKALTDEQRGRFEKAYLDANIAWRAEEDHYKPGQPAVAAVVAAVPGASSESSDSSDSDSEDYPSNALNHTPAAIPNLASAVPASAKKEKKRKNKQADAAVPAAFETPDKKKKKHKD
ncbi:hypothetical protein Q5752_000991 [Cryptotrichosporon argae]